MDITDIKAKVEQHLVAVKERMEETSSICGGMVKAENEAFFAAYKAGAYATLSFVEAK